MENKGFLKLISSALFGTLLLTCASLQPLHAAKYGKKDDKAEVKSSKKGGTKRRTATRGKQARKNVKRGKRGTEQAGKRKARRNKRSKTMRGARHAGQAENNRRTGARKGAHTVKAGARRGRPAKQEVAIKGRGRTAKEAVASSPRGKVTGRTTKRDKKNHAAVKEASARMMKNMNQ
jgi:hypothetical protein